QGDRTRAGRCRANRQGARQRRLRRIERPQSHPGGARGPAPRLSAADAGLRRPAIRHRGPAAGAERHAAPHATQSQGTVMDAALLRRVEQQRVALLYGNTLAVSGAALLMAGLVTAIARPRAERLSILLWCAAVVI